MKTKKPPFCWIARSFVLSVSLPVSAGAAVLTGTVNTSPSTSADLTAIGTTSWAVWNYASGSSGVTLAPSNRDSGSPTIGTAGYISGISRVGGAAGSTVRGGNASQMQFSYSDGDSPTTFGPAISGLVFPSSLDAVNNGVSLTVTGDPGQLYQVMVWASGVGGQGTMTASLNGASNVVLLSQTYTTTASGDGAKNPTLFTFNFQPDNASDLLNLSFVLTTDTAGTNNSHVGISAVAVSAIPEPGSVALALVGGLALFRRRRG